MRCSTCSATPGATTMRRSTGVAVKDPTGSVMGAIVAFLGRRGLRLDGSVHPAPPGGIDDGGTDRRTGRRAHLDGGPSLPGDGALLSGHARPHATLRQVRFHQLRLEWRAAE